MSYDLHSHTTASDGLLSPEQLVHRAQAMRVSVLAITDHDCTTALAAAQAEIERAGLTICLIHGVEISTLWQNHEIHLLGLNVDSLHPALCQLLEQQALCRDQRAELISNQLAKAGIADTLSQAQHYAAGGAITRAHFARTLLERGHASSFSAVFKRYLSKGKIGYVPAQWCTMPQAIVAIQHAGGQAVLAHPARYNLSTKWLKRLIAQFANDGGDGMEVAQCQQAPGERKRLAEYASEFGLLASQGSDFHQPCAWIELGRNLWLPAGVKPVWQVWNLPAHISERQA